MDSKLLIKTLELLEETYPETYSIKRLIEKLNTPLDGEFSKIIDYLRTSGKISVDYKEKEKRGNFSRYQRDDRIKIIDKGIDFLETKKLLMTNERRNEYIKWATVVIAASAAINLIIFLINLLPKPL